jgi:hypothetical protein
LGAYPIRLSDPNLHTPRLDPRIKRIKQEEKEAREAKKKSKSQIPGKKTKEEEEEEKRRAEEEAKRKEEEEKVRLAMLCFHIHYVSNRIRLGCTCGSKKSKSSCSKCGQKSEETTAGCRRGFIIEFAIGAT